MSVRLMSRVWELDLPQNEKLILLAFADHADDDGVCFPSIARIAWKSGYSERQTRAIVSKLRRRKVLEAIEGHAGGRGLATTYLIHPENHAKLACFQGENPAVERSKRVQSATKKGAKSRKKTARIYKPYLESSVEPSHTDSSAVCLQILQTWNENRGSLPQVTKLTQERRAFIAKRLKSDADFPEKFKLATQRAACTPFLCGTGPSGWILGFDWLIKNDTNYIAVLEGKYDAKNGGANGANRRPAGGHFSQVDQNWDQPVTVFENKRRVQ